MMPKPETCPHCGHITPAPSEATVQAVNVDVSRAMLESIRDRAGRLLEATEQGLSQRRAFRAAVDDALLDAMNDALESMLRGIETADSNGAG